MLPWCSLQILLLKYCAHFDGRTHSSSTRFIQLPTHNFGFYFRKIKTRYDVNLLCHVQPLYLLNLKNLETRQGVFDHKNIIA